MAATNKCLARSNKSRTVGKATKKRNRQRCIDRAAPPSAIRCPLPDGWYFSFDGEEDPPCPALRSREDAIETAQSYIDENYEDLKS
jgi:hypothetical protein